MNPKYKIERSVYTLYEILFCWSANNVLSLLVQMAWPRNSVLDSDWFHNS